MKKGFTLVELLAVIVTLAIIAIITIPMISNVIEKSKLGAMEDSAYGLIDAANYYYAEHMNEMSSNKIFVIENGVQTSEEKLNYKGKIEGNAKVLLASNGKVALCLTNGKSYAKKGLTDSKVAMQTVSENTQCDITTSENGDIIIDITGGSTSDTINIKLEDMQRQIDDINSSLTNVSSGLSNLVKKITEEISFDNYNGVGKTSLKSENTVPICCEINGMIANIGTVYQGYWYVNLSNYSTGTMLKNTTQTVTIYYLEY